MRLIEAVEALQHPVGMAKVAFSARLFSKYASPAALLKSLQAGRVPVHPRAVGTRAVASGHDTAAALIRDKQRRIASAAPAQWSLPRGQGGQVVDPRLPPLFPGTRL